MHFTPLSAGESYTVPQWVWGSFLWLQGLQLEGFLGFKLFSGVPALNPGVPVILWGVTCFQTQRHLGLT